MTRALSCSEYFNKQNREKNTNYSSTFSGNLPYGASNFSYQIVKNKMLNAKRELEKNPIIENTFYSSYNRVSYYKKGKVVLHSSKKTYGTTSNTEPEPEPERY